MKQHHIAMLKKADEYFLDVKDKELIDEFLDLQEKSNELKSINFDSMAYLMKIDSVVHDYIVAHINATGSFPDKDTIESYIDTAKTVLAKVELAAKDIERDNRRRGW